MGGISRSRAPGEASRRDTARRRRRSPGPVPPHTRDNSASHDIHERHVIDGPFAVKTIAPSGDTAIPTGDRRPPPCPPLYSRRVDDQHRLPRPVVTKTCFPSGAATTPSDA
jgi:hypothetical protein